MTGRKDAHTSSKALQIHKVFPAAFSSSGCLSVTAKLLAPDSDGFSCDFWLLRRRCVVTPRNQIKAQQSGFDLKRKKERAKCSFRRKAETKWRKFLLTMRKGQKAPERHAVRRMCSCQPRVTSVHNILYVYNMTNSAQKQHIFSNMRIFQTCAQIRWSTTSVPADRQDARRGCAFIGIFCTIPVLSLASAK